MAYIKDSIMDEELKRAKKTMKLKHANDVAYQYLELMKKIWPAPRDYRDIPEKVIISNVKDLYPKVQDPYTILEEQIESGVMCSRRITILI